jgi:transforming growth factor-beta-induced protein
MLWKVSSVFAFTAALSAAMVVAEDKPQPGQAPRGTVTARKPVVDEAKKMDVVDTAVKAGTFKTLAAAIKAAGLTETLKGQGPFTVFAPTDEAFAKLPKGTLESLLRPENKEELKALLTYHVLPGNFTAAEVAKMKEAETVNGQSLTIVKHFDHVMVNEAKITQTDIVCGNGAIHVIDTVLMPKASQK